MSSGLSLKRALETTEKLLNPGKLRAQLRRTEDRNIIQSPGDLLYVNRSPTRDLVLVCPCREGGGSLSPGRKAFALGCHGGRSGRSSHPSLKRPLSLRAARGGPVGVIERDEQYSWYLLLKAHKGKYLAKRFFASGTI